MPRLHARPAPPDGRGRRASSRSRTAGSAWSRAGRSSPPARSPSTRTRSRPAPAPRPPTASPSARWANRARGSSSPTSASTSTTRSGSWSTSWSSSTPAPRRRRSTCSRRAARGTLEITSLAEESRAARPRRRRGPLAAAPDINPGHAGHRRLHLRRDVARLQALDRVRRADGLGFDSVYTTHIAGRDSLALLMAYASVSERVAAGHRRGADLLAHARGDGAGGGDDRRVLRRADGPRARRLPSGHGRELVRREDRKAGDADARVRGHRARDPARRGAARGRVLQHQVPVHGLRAAAGAADLRRRPVPQHAPPGRARSPTG